LRQQGARCFVLCVGHLAEQIQAELGDGRALGVQIEYSVEEEGRLLGTAGALKLAERYFTPHALVLNGDTFFDIDYAGLCHRHIEERHRRSAVATLALARLAERTRYGNVVLDVSGRTIIAFKEKNADSSAATAWVSGGAYVIEHTLLEDVPREQACSLERDVFPHALAQGRTLAAATFTNRFFDIGTPEAWKQFVEYYHMNQHPQPNLPAK
jgi:mannose-1-phosphate guanylyltransferase